MIVNVVLHLITLFTKHAEIASILFGSKKILAFIFNKLKVHGSNSKNSTEIFNLAGDAEQKKHYYETIRLATLALSRLSSKFDP